MKRGTLFEAEGVKGRQKITWNQGVGRDERIWAQEETCAGPSKVETGMKSYQCVRACVSE